MGVELIYIVNDMQEFMEVNLAELDARLHDPVRFRASSSAYEIVSKLAEVGLELEILSPGEMIECNSGDLKLT